MARKSHRKRRRHSRSLLSNPFSSVSGLLSKPKEMFTKEFALQATATAAGFMAPNIVMNYIPVQFRASKMTFYLSKIAVVAGLSTAVGMVNKTASRAVLIGGGVSLLLDLWAEYQAHAKATATPAPAPAGTSAFYGPGMGAFYGDSRGMGDDLVLTSPDGTY
jgi:hypothetical protein